jgi:hypothetical protein
MGGEPQPLAFVEERVMDRGEVLKLGEQRRRQAFLRDPEVGSDRAADLRRQPPIPASRVCADRSRTDRDVVALGEESLELCER